MFDSVGKSDKESCWCEDNMFSNKSGDCALFCCESGTLIFPIISLKFRKRTAISTL